MPTPPTSIPAQIFAGDTALWSRSFDDYRSTDGWSLKYTLVSATIAYNFAAAAEPDGSFLVTVADSTTNGWVPGRYSLVEYVDKDPQRFTLNKEVVVVVPILAGATGGVDTRSHARKMLDLINAYFEKKLPNASRVMLDGLRIDSHPLPDLLVIRDRYRAEVAREEQIASGAPAPRLLARF